MDTKYNLAGQFIRFAIVGAVNTLLDFAILNLLSWATGIYEGNGIIPLNVISFTVAVVNSYFLNKAWAFKDRASEEQGKKFTLFLIVSVIGAIINTATVRIVSTNIDPMFGLSQELWLNAAKVIATGLSLVWNFIGYKVFVFKK
ncbi:MAG: GtrA family protein [Candidatus Doudnabacteria bacterium]|nr:GtrA family protein [Candidatus Doudnabacteria bacterium]